MGIDTETAKAVERDRAKLKEMSKELDVAQKELDKQRAEIDQQFVAINAYEAALKGKTVSASAGPRRKWQVEVLGVVQGNPGVKPVEIIEAMGVKGDKSGENSIRNALTNLKKANKVAASDGQYSVA